MSRTEAYKWLAEALGIDGQDCHIGMMDADTANRAADLVLEFK